MTCLIGSMISFILMLIVNSHGAPAPTRKQDIKRISTRSGDVHYFSTKQLGEIEIFQFLYISLLIVFIVAYFVDSARAEGWFSRRKE